MAAHAKLSASSAPRWLNCPGSVRAIAALPPEERNRTSVHAEEGSAAHALAELCLRTGSDPGEHLGRRASPNGLEGPSDPDLPGFAAGGPWFDVDEDMVEAVRVYTREVAHHLERLPGAEVLVERRASPLDDRPDMWGTTDVAIFDPLGCELVMVDYKHGRGVTVEVERNGQAMYYALGVLRHFGVASVDRVVLVIVQPRAPHADGPVRRWEVSAADLVAWGDDVLRPGALATEAPDAPLVAGPWCRKTFCAAAATCPALQSAALEEARVDFAAPVDPAKDRERAAAYLPDPEDADRIARILRAAPLLDFLLRESEGMAQRLLERGVDVPGFKLVAKRSNRRWRDEAEVERKLKNRRGVRRQDVYDVKLRSPAKLEKVRAIGKEWVAKHAEKPEGGRTVAPIDDARPALSPPAETDFGAASLPAQGESFLD